MDDMTLPELVALPADALAVYLRRLDMPALFAAQQDVTAYRADVLDTGRLIQAEVDRRADAAREAYRAALAELGQTGPPTQYLFGEVTDG